MFYRTKNLDAGKEFGAQFAEFEDLLRESDVVIISCSLNETTKGLFNKDVFAKMKNTGILINISRGLVINQEDLVEALNVRMLFLIHVVNHTRPVVITIFTRVVLSVRTSVTTYQNQAKQNRFLLPVECGLA